MSVYITEKEALFCLKTCMTERTTSKSSNFYFQGAMFADMAHKVNIFDNWTAASNTNRKLYSARWTNSIAWLHSG